MRCFVCIKEYYIEVAGWNDTEFSFIHVGQMFLVESEYDLPGNNRYAPPEQQYTECYKEYSFSGVEVQREQQVG